MEIVTPTEAARHAGTKYRSILVAARFARMVNELPKEKQVQLEQSHEYKKLTTLALRKLASGELAFRELRRRRSEV
ncbi:MAG: DNA-directed RNA polymerase subunit omega [Gemmatimonadales bacterium]